MKQLLLGLGKRFDSAAIRRLIAWPGQSEGVRGGEWHHILTVMVVLGGGENAKKVGGLEESLSRDR